MLPGEFLQWRPAPNLEAGSKRRRGGGGDAQNQRCDGWFEDLQVEHDCKTGVMSKLALFCRAG